MLTSSKEDLVGYIKDPTLRWSPIFGAAIAGLGAVLLTSGIKPFDSSVVGAVFSLAMKGTALPCQSAKNGNAPASRYMPDIEDLRGAGEELLRLLLVV